MRILSLVTFFLMVIGAINWLLVGVARFDLVRFLFGRVPVAKRVVYDAVGVAGITQLVTYIIRMVRGTPAPVTGMA